MKQNDYSTIASIEELRKCRVEAEARLCRVKKSIKLDYLILKKSLTFTNLVATMLSDFSIVRTFVGHATVRRRSTHPAKP